MLRVNDIVKPTEAWGSNRGYIETAIVLAVLDGELLIEADGRSMMVYFYEVEGIDERTEFRTADELMDYLDINNPENTEDVIVYTSEQGWKEMVEWLMRQGKRVEPGDNIEESEDNIEVVRSVTISLDMNIKGAVKYKIAKWRG